MKIYQLRTSIKTVLISIFISFSLSSFAINHIENKSYFDHLSEVNKEWFNHSDASPKGSIAFRSDLDRIQLHLNLVIEHLKTNIPSEFSAVQKTKRLLLLDKLQQYTDNKVFPVNKHHAVRQPYFVDEIGTNCAVGQLIYVSGHQELVAKISKEHNYDYIKDIHTEGLTEWANEFGFTIEELKWIQPGYAPNQTIDQVKGGTNGKVVKVVNNNYDANLIIIGKFTELDSLPCLNIGTYKNNQLSCLGNGVNGIINDVIVQSGIIYAFGEIINNGQIYPIAAFENSVWNFISIPGRNNATATAANYGGYGYKYEVAISHNSIPQKQEIWRFIDNNSLEKKALVNGVILDIIASQYGRVHAGHFDSVFVYNSSALIDTTLVVNNVVINENYSNFWYGIGTNISDTVNTISYIGNALIFGGTCSNQPGENNICISKYFNTVLQPLFLNYSQVSDFSINTIAYKDGNEFTFGGDFDLVPSGIGSYGSNLATYNLISNSVNPIAIFDKPVNSLSYFNSKLYIGGDFQTNMGQIVNHLGQLTTTLGVNENIADINLNVFPNPFHSTLNLKGIENGATYSILFIDGRIAKTGTVKNEEINDLDFLPNGTYLLQLKTEKGLVVRKVFK